MADSINKEPIREDDSAERDESEGDTPEGSEGEEEIGRHEEEKAANIISDESEFWTKELDRIEGELDPVRFQRATDLVNDYEMKLIEYRDALKKGIKEICQEAEGSEASIRGSEEVTPNPDPSRTSSENSESNSPPTLELPKDTLNIESRFKGLAKDSSFDPDALGDMRVMEKYLGLSEGYSGDEFVKRFTEATEAVFQIVEHGDPRWEKFERVFRSAGEEIKRRFPENTSKEETTGKSEETTPEPIDIGELAVEIHKLHTELENPGVDPAKIESIKQQLAEKEAAFKKGWGEKEKAARVAAGQEGIPVMITRDMEQQLSDLGWNADARGNLAPQAAWEIIKEGKTFSQPENKDVPPIKEAAPLPDLPLRVEEIKREMAGEGKVEQAVRHVEQSLQEEWEKWKREVFSPAENMVDRVRLMWNERLFIQYDNRAAKARFEVQGLDEKISEAEARLQTYDADREKKRTELGTKVTEESRLAEYKERQVLAKSIEGLKTERRRAKSNLDTENRNRKQFEDQRKRIAREYSERLKDQMAPYEREIEEVKKARNQYDSEIEAFASEQFRNESKVRDLEEGLKDSWSKADKLAYKAAIAEIKAVMKTGRKELNLRLSEREKLESNLGKLEDKVNPWRDKKDELAALSNRREESLGTSSQNAPEAVRTETPPEANQENSARAPVNEAPAPVERGEPRFSPARYVDEWNRFFATGLRIDANRLFGEMGVRRDAQVIMSVERAILRYFERAQAAGKTRLTKKDMQRNFKFLRSIITPEKQS
ncbi:MAG: hypothetical protein AAB518_02430 [Patescibacteria group bacterium]